MRRMAEVRSAERRFGDAADGKHSAAACELPGERQPGLDLPARRRPVRSRSAGMRRHDVPEEHGVREVELGEHAVDDGCGRLARRLSGELPLRCERDARDTRAAVSPRLANEQQRRVGMGVEVAVEALGESLVAVLVERVADPRARETVYQRSQCTTSSAARRRCENRLDARLAFGSGRALPTVTPATTCTSSGMPSSSLNASISGTVTP
jgi:hypothetical protein